MSYFMTDVKYLRVPSRIATRDAVVFVFCVGLALGAFLGGAL